MQALGVVQNIITQLIIADHDDKSLANNSANNFLINSHQLQIYRNNNLFTLTKALRTTYPVLEKIVGEDFFKGMAYAYIQAHPSRFRDLNDFGHHLPDFIAIFSPASTLPYLSEVAQLEWACHEVFSAPDVAPVDLSALQNIPEAQYDTVKFSLSPASRLFSFQYPIFHIWQLCHCQNNPDASVNLAEEEGVKLLVVRQAMEVELHVLTAGEYALLSALANTLELGTACQLALEAEQGFDIGAALKKYVLSAILIIEHV